MHLLEHVDAAHDAYGLEPDANAKGLHNLYVFVHKQAPEPFGGSGGGGGWNSSQRATTPPRLYKMLLMKTPLNLGLRE